MLGVGDRVGDGTIWLGPNERASIAGLYEDGPIMLLFFLFAWSST